MYELIKKELISLLEEEKNFIANASNFSALIFNRIKSLNWVGFYFISGDELVLGPFQGKPACIRIKLGNGVCGTSAIRKETIVVPNVNEFPGHIACDSVSNSEIVIPLIDNNKLYGVLDIDSPAFNRFTEEDKKGLEELLSILIYSSNIKMIDTFY